MIDLKPGSILYFPSGMWHKVETISDKSLSINLSIVPMTYSQLFNKAINHYMSINPIFRKPILYNNMNQTHEIINNLSKKLNNFVSNINKYPSCLTPYSFSNYSLSSNNTVCIETINFDDEDNDEQYNNTAKPPEITINDKFILNPLSVMTPFNQIYPNKSSAKSKTNVDEQDLVAKFCTFEDLEDECDDDDEDDDNGCGDKDKKKRVRVKYYKNTF